MIAFLLTALVTGAVVYTFATSDRNHTQNRTQVVEQR
jgi:hypothetical protein